MISKEAIRTKLVYEVQPSRFLSIGFGNISKSEADIICLSSFTDELITSQYQMVDHSIGGQSYNIQDTPIQSGHCYLFDWADNSLYNRKLLIIAKGNRNQSTDSLILNIKMGLTRSIQIINKVKDELKIDITALGVGIKHGDIHRKESFDILADWVLNIFTQCKNISQIRFVSQNIDTFVDFFEALHRIKSYTTASSVQSSCDRNIQIKYNETIDTLKGQYIEADKRLSQFIKEMNMPNLNFSGVNYFQTTQIENIENNWENKMRDNINISSQGDVNIAKDYATATINKQNITPSCNLINQLKEEISKLELTKMEKREIDLQIDMLQNQEKTKYKNPTIIKETLETITNLIQGAAGSALFEIIKQIGVVMC